MLFVLCSLITNCDEDLTLNSYSGIFSQIIFILVKNSLLHAFKQKGDGEIIFDVFKKKEHIELRYSDNGKGVPEENLKKIFDPFFTTKRNEGGSGLGLHILYNLVRQKINGSIHCSSVAEEGTIFTILFPDNQLSINKPKIFSEALEGS
jgi:signal transduction histidine kinase